MPPLEDLRFPVRAFGRRGLGFRVWGLGFRVPGSGFSVYLGMGLPGCPIVPFSLFSERTGPPRLDKTLIGFSSSKQRPEVCALLWALGPKPLSISRSFEVCGLRPLSP